MRKALYIFITLFFYTSYNFSQLTISYTATESRCQSSGSISVSAGGGNVPYLYEIIAGPTTRPQQNPNTFNGLPSGTYTIRVVDNVGAIINTSAIVPGNYSAITATTSAKNASCLDNDGKIFINASGGRLGYQYELIAPSPTIRPIQAIDSFTNLSSGNYSVRIYDSCSNFITVNQAISIPTGTLDVIDFRTDSITCDSVYARITMDNSFRVDRIYPPKYYLYDANDITDTIESGYLPLYSTKYLTFDRNVYWWVRMSAYDTCGSITNDYIIERFNFFGLNYEQECNGYFTLNFLSGIYNYTDTVNLSYEIISGPTLKPIQYGNNYYFDSLLPGLYNVRACDTSCGTCLTTSVNIRVNEFTNAYGYVRNYCDTGRGELQLAVRNATDSLRGVIISAPVNFPHSLPYSSNDNGATRISFWDIPDGNYDVWIYDSCLLINDTVSVTLDLSDVGYISKQVTVIPNCNNTFSVNIQGQYNSLGQGSNVNDIDILDSNLNLVNSSYPAFRFETGGVSPRNFNYTFFNVITTPGTYYVRSNYIRGAFGLCSAGYFLDTIVVPTGYTPPIIDDATSYLCKDSTFGQTSVSASGGIRPYSYEIISGPVTFPPQSDSNFYSLPIGTYQIRLVDTCGNSFTLATEVTPYGIGNINYTNPVCIGNNFSAIADTLPGATYQWTGPNAFLSNQRDFSLTPLTINDTGIYSLHISFGTCIDTIISFPVYGDTFSPIANCKDTTVYLNSSGNISIDSSFVNNGSSDNCGMITFELSTNTFSCSNIGANNIDVIVKDLIGNADTCTSIVTVLDTTSPSAICQNRTIYLNGAGNATITPAQVNNGSTDNCAISTYSLSQTSFNCSDTGANSVTLIVTDVNSNVDSCFAIVTVLDTIPPVVNCQNISVYLNASGNATITSAQVNSASTDNCAIASYLLSKTTFNCSDLGANSVTLIVTDVNSNIDSCTATVTILDTFSITPSCKDTSVYLNAGGTVTLDSSFVITAGSGCSAITSVTISQNSFNCSDVGLNAVNVLINGSIGCVSNVTVIDTIPPVANCQNIITYLDGSGNATITSAQINNGSTDNCAISTYSLSQTSFNCSDTGANSVTLIVTDVNSNVDSCLAIVTVLDTIPPVVNCQNISVYLNASGNATITPAQVNSASTDNCAIASYLLSKTAFNCSDIGANSVTLTITDINSNIDSCSATVTILDTFSVSPSCKDTIVYLNVGGTVTLDSSFVITAGSGCSAINSATISQNAFTCADTGINIINILINGVTSCSSTITVVDTIPPNAICQNITAFLDSNGIIILDSNAVNNGSWDNCGIETMSISPNTFTCNNIGINTVTLTVYDINGNVSSCQSNVTVLDNISPAFSCPQDMNDTILGNCEFVIPDYILQITATDNCNSNNIVYSQNPLAGSIIAITPNNPTSNTIVYITATDSSNNSNSCFFNVNVSCVQKLQIPQFFSPNNDGINDKWEIIGIENFPNNNVKIYNRYGQLVYKKINYNNSWGGEVTSSLVLNSIQTDKTLPSGTYYYVLTTYYLDEETNYNGFVHIKM